MTNVVRLPVRGHWAWDSRGSNRAVRVSAHDRENVVNLSVWRDDICVGTVRLQPVEVAHLMTGLSEALAQLVRRPETPPEAGSRDAERLREMERRLVLVESRLAARPWRSAVSAAADRARGVARAVRSAARGDAAR